MIITKLDKVGTKQVRLFFDEEKYCLLYYNEIRRLGFHEQDEVGQEEFDELNKLLLHRAKLKAMSLLKYQVRTRKELKDRLMRAEFPEFITEGAIPFAASDPLHVIPACVIGSGLAGALSMAFNCTLMAPHGGIFVFPVVGNGLMYFVALVVGTIVSAVLLGALKKKVA